MNMRYRTNPYFYRILFCVDIHIYNQLYPRLMVLSIR
jgi:hypothetical protein